MHGSLPKCRDYSYFSHVHTSYTRIDLIFTQHSYLDRVKKADVGSITISDHAPVFIDMEIVGSRRPPFQWKLNDSLIQDPEGPRNIAEELTSYFMINTQGETSPMMTWEAHKAFIRGIFIRHGSRLKRQRAEKITSLLKKIH